MDFIITVLRAITITHKIYSDISLYASNQYASIPEDMNMAILYVDLLKQYAKECYQAFTFRKECKIFITASSVII